MATLFLVARLLCNTFVEAWPGPRFGSISGTRSESGDGDEIWVETEDKCVTGIPGSHSTRLATVVFVLGTILPSTTIPSFHLFLINYPNLSCCRVLLVSNLLFDILSSSVFCVFLAVFLCLDGSIWWGTYKSIGISVVFVILVFFLFVFLALFSPGLLLLDPIGFHFGSGGDLNIGVFHVVASRMTFKRAVVHISSLPDILNLFKFP